MVAASGRDTNLGVASSHSAHSEENGTKVAQKCRGRCKYSVDYYTLHNIREGVVSYFITIGKLIRSD